MTARDRAEEYLALRRSLGYELKPEGRIVLAFAGWLDETAQSTITAAAAALAWACEPATSPNQHARRLSAVRGFARHMAAFDPGGEIPSPDLLPARTHRPRAVSVFAGGDRRSDPCRGHDRGAAALRHDARGICLIAASGMRPG